MQSARFFAGNKQRTNMVKSESVETGGGLVVFSFC